MKIERHNRSLMFPKIGKISVIIFAILLLTVGFRAFQLYGYIFSPNVNKDFTIQISTGANYEDVLTLIKGTGNIENMKAFKWVAKKKKYPDSVKPGNYEFKKGMNTNQIINTLRAGNQTPIGVTFNNVRFRRELAGKVASYLECDSASILLLLENSEVAKQYGFTYQNFPTMFIPNTYEMYWTTTPDEFVKRMDKEHKKFWNDSRKKKAQLLGLTDVEISILASIVQEETAQNDEKSKIAGVYINRLKRGIPLQADPSIKFSMGDFSIRRITTNMLSVDSPYNTYKYAGLPPGPICFPDINSIDAVLNAEKHNYIYFCAKEDFSGYHNFAKTLSEHNRNAARYQQALNKKRIWH